MRPRIILVVILSLLFADICLAQTTHHKKKPTKPPARIKVAEGSYAFYTRTGEVLTTFEEPWALTKTPVGFELSEQWRSNQSADSQQGPMAVEFNVMFTTNMQPLTVHIGNKDSKTGITCSLSLTDFTCIGADKSSSVPVQSPYNFFLPSPWMMSAIARRSKKELGGFTDVRMVYLDGMTADGPKLESFSAQVIYKGQEQFTAAGRIFTADKFEIINPGSFPDMKIWVNPEGITLAMEDSSKADQRMVLTTYKQYVKF